MTFGALDGAIETVGAIKDCRDSCFVVVNNVVSPGAIADILRVLEAILADIVGTNAELLGKSKLRVLPSIFILDISLA